MAGGPRDFLRVLPLRTAVSTSAGLASAAINFLACVEVAEFAGGRSAWLALLVAGGLITLSASHFAELTGLFPSAAAIRVWSKRGSSETVSLVSSLVYAATVLFVIAADAFVLGHVFQNAVPFVPGLVWILVILAGVTVANLRGVRVAGRIQDINGFFLLLTLLVISSVALLRAPHIMAHPFQGLWHLGPGWVQSVALGVFIYVGYEWVTPLAEEFSDVRAIPRGMYLALGLIAVGFGVFTLALQVYQPDAARLAQSFVPQLVLGRRALGAWGYWWMVVVTLSTAMTTFNGGLVAASRFVYALARERVLPAAWAKLNHRLVPSTALVGLASLAFVLAVLVYVSGWYLFLVNTGAAVEGFMYALVAFLVIRLRRREPDRERPFRAWGVPWLSVVLMVVFLGLGVGSLTAPSGIPGRVPWPLVFLATLTVLGYIYTVRVVPRLKAKRAQRMGSPKGSPR